MYVKIPHKNAITRINVHKFKKLKVGDSRAIIYEPGKGESFNKLSVLFQMAVRMHSSWYLK
jgi:hypothetical protein